ncbi:MAG: hypothetical protein H6657_10245 [Ardenticatenaceae bacterium]|nr:hypothetical protein [Ardenticatenaceae bacterium]
MTQYVDPVHLRQVLTQYYSEGELRTMCFDMGIDYESIGGRGKAEKVADLVIFAQRNGRLNQFAAYVRQTRSFIQLRTTDTLPPLPEAVPGVEGSVTYNVQGNLIHGDLVQGDLVKGDKVNEKGGITVGNLSGVSGVAIGEGAQAHGGDIYMGAPEGKEPKTKEDFTTQLQELTGLLKKAIADGEFKDERDGQDALEEIQKVSKEIDSENPRASSIERGLNNLNGILGGVAKVVEAAGKTGAAVLKATPIIAGLIKAVSILF